MKHEPGPQFTKVPKWLIRSDVSPAAIRVYAEIGLHDGGSSFCTVSMAKLGAYVGLSDRTVRWAVQELEGVGAIRVVRRFGQTSMLKTFQNPEGRSASREENPERSPDDIRLVAVDSRAGRPSVEEAPRRVPDIAPVDLREIVAETSRRNAEARERAAGGDL